jgi:uncharacterized protein
MKTTIKTISGKTINFAEPKAGEINIFDIAKGLAYRSRWAGQTKEYYSVAQHSIHVMQLLEEEFVRLPQIKLVALLHDASEAYMADIPTPLKNLLPGYKYYENLLQTEIYKAYGLELYAVEYYAIIKRADIKSMELEKEGIGTTLKGMQPEEVYQMYLEVVNKIACNKHVDFSSIKERVQESRNYFNSLMINKKAS